MEKIKKGFSFKILCVSMGCLLYFTDTLHSQDILRIPMAGTKRAGEAISYITDRSKPNIDDTIDMQKLDFRPTEGKLLSSIYVGHDMAVKNIVNPHMLAIIRTVPKVITVVLSAADDSVWAAKSETMVPLGN